MLVYAGIDEAGYGPIFGPLVIARTVFVLEHDDPLLSPPSLWTLLQKSVCRRPQDHRGRIAINDSKALYTPALGLANLERGVLAFLDLLDLHPERLDDLLAQICLEGSVPLEHPCYLDPTGGPVVPVHLDPQSLRTARRRLRRVTEGTGIRLLEVKAAVLLEDRYNREVIAAGNNKALAAWKYVAAHLAAIWERYGECSPHVVIDRQGGRIYYLELLASLFPTSRLCVLLESGPESRYEISAGSRRMLVTVQVESERRHLPTAFASMSAKYVRELLLMRFQSFWRQHAPAVRPTYGYYGDGRRFLREVEMLFPLLHLERDQIVRRS